MDKIKFFRLVTGDEIVAGTKEFSTEGYTTLTKPARIGITPDGNLAIMPLCPFSKDEEITINDSQILFSCNPVDEIKNGYNEKYGSGIVMAPSTLIT